MITLKNLCVSGATVLLFITATAHGGPLDPECDAKKAGKSVAMKATVGVGGRCSPKEAASDTAKDSVIDNDKDRKKGRKSEDGVAKKGFKKAID